MCLAELASWSSLAALALTRLCVGVCIGWSAPVRCGRMRVSGYFRCQLQQAEQVGSSPLTMHQVASH